MAQTNAMTRAPLRPLAAAFAALFSAGSGTACAALAVTNCNNSGAGSLRASVLAAAEGDTVDATQLQCSTISLTSGFIIVAQNSLKIAGPGMGNLKISGSQETMAYNIFFHNGNGTLQITDLAVTRGNKYLNDSNLHLGGGCISSSGNVILNRTSITDCQMSAGHQSRARGGGVFATGSLTLTDSVVSGNVTSGAEIGSSGYYDPTFGGGLFAYGPIKLTRTSVLSNGATHGGGIYAAGALAIYSSSISNNYGDSGAGIKGRGSLWLQDSTVASNRGHSVGGIYMALPQSPAGKTVTVRSSTISGNTSTSNYSTPGLVSLIPTTISHSTIAFNRDYSGDPGAALVVGGATLQLDTSIVAENIPLDVFAGQYTTASGAANFINNGNVTLSGTLGGCPRLQYLGDNGGLTQTLALRPGSPAIDAGANPTFLPYDQRGAGFPRVVGGIADIGAYEWQGEIPDALFRSGFNYGEMFCDW